MIKVIVIDDESVARDTICKYCEKYAPGFEIVKCFDNGADALEYLNRNDVDLVFTDVKMPGISGIEVAKWLYENKPYIKTVVVSGYSDFYYAKQALEYGVLYYLLKVIDIDSFCKLVDKITKDHKKKIYNYKTVELKDFFFNVIYGTYEDCEQMLGEFKIICQIAENAVTCRLMTLKFEKLDSFLESKWHYSRERFQNAIVNIIQKTYCQCFAMLINENSSVCEYLLMFPVSDSGIIKNGEITDKIKEIMDMDCTASSEEMSVKELYEKYNECDEAKVGEIEANGYKTENILIERVMEYIEENFSKGILKNNVADYFNINKDYLGRLFKEETGMSITEYMLKIRISEAKRLIGENYSPSEICRRVGYIDMRNFRRLFHKETGMTIQEYKDSLKGSRS